MAKQCCANCIYSYWSLGMKMNSFSPGFPCGPLCANHPDTPGQLRQVASSGICRNWRPKPDTPAGDIKRIPLGDNMYALVDAADYEWLRRYNWRLQNGYAARREKGKVTYMHREIMQPPKGMMVDHSNRNRLDNCRSNLRVCTRQQNTHNNCKHMGSSSRFKGVGYSKEHHKWFAKIWFEGVRIWLGLFEDEVEAAHAYDRKAVEFFGEFAHLNFPEEWPPQRRQQVHADAQPLRDALQAKDAQAKAKRGKGKKAKGKNSTARTERPARRGRTRRPQAAKQTRHKPPRKPARGQRAKKLKAPRPEGPR